MPKWTKRDLDLAVHKVKSKQMSFNKAAKVFEIPLSTLHSHVMLHAVTTRVLAGRPTVLTYHEEQEIVYCCQVIYVIICLKGIFFFNCCNN